MSSNKGIALLPYHDNAPGTPELAEVRRFMGPDPTFSGNVPLGGHCFGALCSTGLEYTPTCTYTHRQSNHVEEAVSSVA